MKAKELLEAVLKESATTNFGIWKNSEGAIPSIASLRKQFASEIVRIFQTSYLSTSIFYEYYEEGLRAIVPEPDCIIELKPDPIPNFVALWNIEEE